jgi:hypothetical protein
MKSHLSVLSSCVGPRDDTVLVARCSRIGVGGDHMVLMLTRRRLVITASSRLTRRLRLHLSLELHDLADVTWTPEPDLGGVRLHATAIDGVREHIWIEAPDVIRVGELLDNVFRGVALAAATDAALAAAT